MKTQNRKFEYIWYKITDKLYIITKIVKNIKKYTSSKSLKKPLPYCHMNYTWKPGFIQLLKLQTF